MEIYLFDKKIWKILLWIWCPSIFYICMDTGTKQGIRPTKGTVGIGLSGPRHHGPRTEAMDHGLLRGRMRTMSPSPTARAGDRPPPKMENGERVINAYAYAHNSAQRNVVPLQQQHILPPIPTPIPANSEASLLKSQRLFSSPSTTATSTLPYPLRLRFVTI